MVKYRKLYLFNQKQNNHVHQTISIKHFIALLAIKKNKKYIYICFEQEEISCHFIIQR